MISKRWLAGLSLIGVLAAWPAKSQEYPSHVITMIVPFPAGGPTDLVGRLVANVMSKELDSRSSSKTWAVPAARSALLAWPGQLPTATRY